ncbi:phage shock envelope stress response protein PspM [Polymorphospora rubra]|uniref:phage shock envelope stress response protein PspM n=1 Tax=Polymorphospora rubra TaxID=338584 RepID=UPI0034074094
MADQRARYFRRLRKLRRSARRWSVLGGGFGGAAAILIPYAGVGLPDAAWAAAAGGSIALAAWRWIDLRALAAQPAPPPPEPVDPEQARARLVAAVERLPAGRAAMDEVRRQRSRMALRGSSAAEPAARLDRASVAMAGLAGDLTGVADSAVLDAAVAERSLRELAQRVAGVERALRVAPADSRGGLEEAHRSLVDQLSGGVTAYERLVAAAAGFVAEDGRGAEHPAVTQLSDASERLRGVASDLAELRKFADPMRTQQQH